MIQRNTLKSLILLTSCYFVIAGCGNNNDSKNDASKNMTVSDSVKAIKFADAKDFLPSWSKKNTIVYQIIAEPKTLHPTNGNSALRAEMNLYTQGFLTVIDLEHLEVAPGIIKSLPSVSPDELMYSYELRDEPKWDDGKQVTVDDIIFTFKANKCPLVENPEAKSTLDNIKDIVVDKSNNRKFTISMKRKHIQNVSFSIDIPIMERTYFDAKNVLSKYSFAKLDDTTFQADKDKDLNDWAKEFNGVKYCRDLKFMNGLGMYKLTNWEQGQSLTLEKKANHWTNGSKNLFEQANPEKIIFKINKDPNSQKLEFKSQELDASASISTKVLTELQKDSTFNQNYNSAFVSTFNYSYIAMNMKPDGIKHKKLFTDKNVRRAMALLCPIDEMNKVLNNNRNKRIAGPVSPLKKEYNADLKLIPFDIEQAKKLLDEAGWKDTDGDNIRDKVIDGQKVQFTFEINFPNAQVEWKDAASMIADAMNKAGIKANLNPLDPGTWHDMNVSHNFDMSMGAWGLNFAPEDYTQMWHSSSWSSNGDNYEGFGTPESDALIDSIKYEVDPVKYIPMVKRLQAIIYDEQPYIFTFSSIKRVVCHKRFGNCEMFFERPAILLSSLKLLAAEDKSAKK